MTGRAFRFPMLVIIVALLVGALVFEDRQSSSSSDRGPSAVAISEMVPTVAAPEALSSTWYCAAGTATGAATGFAEQQVIIANAGDVESVGVITAMSETAATVAEPISIPAHGRITVRVADLVEAPWASVLVEVSGGGVTVVHDLRGPLGRSISPCASAPSSTWYFPSGSTVAGDREVIALFNPFPGEATVDVSFDTEDGARTPQQLQGMVVPGGRVVVVDVSALVTLRERVATTVSARVGRIVAEQIQASEGRNGGDRGLSAVLGATSPAPIWTFPVSMPAEFEGRDLVTFYNPGDSDTEVEVQVIVDDQGSSGAVEPFGATVPARRSVVVDLGSDLRIPKSAGRWLIARSIDGGSVVAERWTGTPRANSSGGLSLMMGIPVGATDWMSPLGAGADVSISALSIVNPSATEVATVSVRLHVKGAVTDLARVDRVRIAPGGRLELDLDQFLIGRADASIEIRSDVAVVVGQFLATTTPIDASTLPSFPRIGTESLLVDVVDPASMADPTSFEGVTTTTSSTTTTSTTTTTLAPGQPDLPPA